MSNQTENKKKGRFFQTIKDNLQKITICLVSVIYITQGMFTIVKKDTTIWDIIGSVGWSVIVGLIITSSLNTSGLKDGRKEDSFVNSMKAYGIAKTEATPYLDKLSSWCEYKNFQNLEIKKKEIIQDAGLNWKAYKFGYYDEMKNQARLSKEQIKAIEDAKHCKIPRITYSEMVSDLPKKRHLLSGKEQAFGETEQDYKNRNMYLDFFYKALIGIVGGLYALTPLLTKENALEMLSGVIWNTTQIIIWLALGVLKYINAKSFMVDEYRQTHIIQKTELFNEFLITMEKNPNVIENYSEDIEIDKYIQEFLDKKEKDKDKKIETEKNEIIKNLKEEDQEKEKDDENRENEQENVLD